MEMIPIISRMSVRVKGSNENIIFLLSLVFVMLKDKYSLRKVKKQVGMGWCSGREVRGKVKRSINILGLNYTIEEVDTVNKFEPRKGEINYLSNEIRIDKNMPEDLKNQVLMHEILHAVFELLGMRELAEDEDKVQSIATALHLVFSTQTIFS